MSQPDLFTARAARDEALERVLRNVGDAWTASALRCIDQIPKGWTGMGEDIRLHVSDQIGSPHDPHVWGGVINLALKRGLLTKTGLRAHMKTKRSHARETPVYRR